MTGGTVTGVDWGGKGQVQRQHRRPRCQTRPSPREAGGWGVRSASRLDAGGGEWGEATRR